MGKLGVERVIFRANDLVGFLGPEGNVGQWSMVGGGGRQTGRRRADVDQRVPPYRATVT